MSENGLTKQELDRIRRFASENKASVLTILIDDIVGSSKMIEKMGDDAFQKLKEKDHDKPFMKIITRSKKGEVIKARGDGFLAVFAEPSTAVERALELQENLYEHEKIRIRIGLSMGQVIVKQVGVHKDVVGHFANWAARAESASEAGHILVTRGIYENAVEWLPKNDPCFSWKRHGSYQLRKREKELELFEPYNTSTTVPLVKPRGICKDDTKLYNKEFIRLINTEVPFQINIWTEKKGTPSGFQDVTVVPKIESFQYNIGDKIAVYFESTEDAYVYIFNIGPTGDIIPLLPNRLCKDNYVKAGMTYKFPSDIADFDWELQDPVGTEIIKVFATKTPADMSRWMKGMWFEPADHRNIRVIASESIEKMPPEQWTESSCSFVVVKS